MRPPVITLPWEDEMDAERRDYDLVLLKDALLAGLGEHQDAYPSHLERGFPHIFFKLAELWGCDIFDPYIDSLIFSNRPDRQGFPAEVALELFRLKNAHEALGLSVGPATTPWESSDDLDLRGRTDR